jgi:uncharacterized phage protein (TIGR02220 family)
MLNTIKYWLEKNLANNQNIINNRVWTMMSNKGFMNYFPFFNEQKIKRLLSKLVSFGILIKEKLAENPWDHTGYYSINSYRFDLIDKSHITNREDQSEPSTIVENDSSLITTKDINKKDNKEKTPFREIIDMFNEITGQKLGRGKISETYKTSIRARIKEGFTVEDFRHVITVKNSEWKADQNMVKFIRPQTLFGTKFESYLQQKETQDIYGASNKNKGLFK